MSGKPVNLYDRIYRALAGDFVYADKDMGGSYAGRKIGSQELLLNDPILALDDLAVYVPFSQVNTRHIETEDQSGTPKIKALHTMVPTGNKFYSTNTARYPEFIPDAENGLPLARTDTDDYLFSDFNCPLAADSDYTLAIVVKGYTNNGGNQPIFGRLNGVEGLRFQISSSDKLLMQHAESTLITSATSITSAFTIITFTYDSTGTSKIHINGVEDSNTATGATSWDGTAVALSYGAANIANIENADLGCFALFSSAKSDVDREVVEGVFAHRYAKQSVLADGHTYRQVAPG